jgi:hypothetical protein
VLKRDTTICSEMYRYFGHIMTSTLTDEEDITKRRNNCIKQVNSLLVLFTHLNQSLNTNYFPSILRIFMVVSFDDFETTT